MYRGKNMNESKQYKRNEWIMIALVVFIFGWIVQPAYAFSQVAPSITYPYDQTNNYGATGFREFIELNNSDRIRQNGTITQIKFRVANPAVLGIFNYTIWRKNSTGATLYDRISITNISAIHTITAGLNTVNVNIPVREGDYYGFSFQVIGAGLQQPIQVSASGHTTNLTTSGTLVYDSQILGFNWGGAGISTAVNGYVIEAYMDSTYSAWIGDSLVAGHPDHYSYLEITTKSNISNTTENHWFNQVNSSYMFTSYQNLGIGGNTTTDIRARLYHDLINKSPAFGFLEGGVNDVSGGVITDGTIIDNWNYMINQTHGNGTTPVIILILPWTAGSNAQMARIDYINQEIQKIALNYTPSIVIDARCTVGVFRVGGAAGNCWDINSIYDSGDNTHLNSAGYNALATAIKNNFTDVYFKSGLSNYINSSGWIVYSGTLNQSTRVNASILPTSDFVNISITSWDTTGTYRKVLTASSNTASNPTTFDIGDFPSNTVIYFVIDGVATEQTAILSNSTGWVTYTYTSGYSTHTFELTTVPQDTTHASIIDSCNSAISWATIGFSILVVLLLAFGGGIALMMLLTHTFDGGVLIRYVIVMVVIITIGAIGLSIANPVVDLIGC